MFLVQCQEMTQEAPQKPPIEWRRIIGLLPPKHEPEPKVFRFVPLVDITAYELADLMARMFPRGPDEDFIDRLPEQLRRHFVERR